MLLTKLMIKSNQGNMLIPIDFVVTIKDKTLSLIKAPRRGLLIEMPSVTQKEINSRFEFDEQNIFKVIFKKVIGGHKLFMEVAPSSTREDDRLFTGTIVFDVTKKLDDAFAKILQKLNNNI